MDRPIIDIRLDAFKAVKSEDVGAVAIIIIKSVQHSRVGTRSEQVNYTIEVENEIFGQIKEPDLVGQYGKPKLQKGKKYLVFLIGSVFSTPKFSLCDFQLLDCYECSEVIVACKEKLSKC